jgi:ribosome-associated protein
MKSKEKALIIAEFIDSRKAENIKILEVKNISGLCDYFIICSASSARGVSALFEETSKEFKKSKTEIHHHEKDETSRWILIDFFDVILHIFLDEAREFYNLEYLWPKAKKIPLPKN